VRSQTMPMVTAATALHNSCACHPAGQLSQGTWTGLGYYSPTRPQTSGRVVSPCPPAEIPFVCGVSLRKNSETRATSNGLTLIWPSTGIHLPRWGHISQTTHGTKMADQDRGEAIAFEKRKRNIDWHDSQLTHWVLDSCLPIHSRIWYYPLPTRAHYVLR